MRFPTLIPAASVLLAGAVSAQTVTVTTASDVIDIDPTTGTVSDLPGPDGLVSFREALIATDNTGGHQTIGFAVTGVTGKLNLIHSIGLDFRAFDSVTIDGTTQTAFSGDTNPAGAEVGVFFSDLILIGPDSVLRGFDGGETYLAGANGVLEGNTGGMHLNVSGPGSRVEGNQAGTIKVEGDDVTVVGNTMDRVRISFVSGTQIGGPALADRNFITGYGFVNGEGLPAGAAIELTGADDTLIENNWVGTTVDGLAVGNDACTMGISLRSSCDGLTVRDNLIAGILGKGQGPHHAGQLFGWAVYFWGSVSDVLFEGNTIGLDSNGEPTLGSVWGVAVDNFSFYTYDGVTLADNVIAGHIFDGVRLTPVATMRLTGNEIYANGWLGIDLLPANFQSGVSANDPLDADAGANGVQNHPVLSSAWNLVGSVRVSGSLDSSPLDTFTVELFASSSCDESGNGEGERFLGGTGVVTDAFGHAAFDVTLVEPVPSGWVVTATATLEPTGATSEFSACIPTLDVVCQQDLGFAGPGTAALSLCGGDLSSGTTADLLLEGAVANQLAFLVLGPAFSPTPLLGGTLVPVQPVSTIVLFTDGAGSVAVPGITGGGGPATLFAQFVYVDSGQTLGWGFSNALQVELLP